MNSKNYDDIIDLPHHVSKKRKPMPRADRGAQFAPFAALTGYDSAVKEAARLTDTKIELDEYELERLNELLHLVLQNPSTDYSITYFVPDKRKKGGSYQTAVGNVKAVDEYDRIVIMTDGRKIPIDDIYNIEPIYCE